MVRKAKARQPVRHVQACQVCDGSGRTLDEDYDPEYGARIVPVPCEGCDGTGWLADCAMCGLAAVLMMRPDALDEAEQLRPVSRVVADRRPHGLRAGRGDREHLGVRGTVRGAGA